MRRQLVVPSLCALCRMLYAHQHARGNDCGMHIFAITRCGVRDRCLSSARFIVSLCACVTVPVCGRGCTSVWPVLSVLPAGSFVQAAEGRLATRYLATRCLLPLFVLLAASCFFNCSSRRFRCTSSLCAKGRVMSVWTERPTAPSARTVSVEHTPCNKFEV